MAAAVAGAGGGAGGGDPPQYPSICLFASGNDDDEEPDSEADLSSFARRLCKKCGKHEYLRKGGCANPSCV